MWSDISNLWAVTFVYINQTFFFRALEYCLDVEKLNLSTIRTVRVLRPLRAINRIPSKNKWIAIGLTNQSSHKILRYWNFHPHLVQRRIVHGKSIPRYERSYEVCNLISIFFWTPLGMRILVMLLLDTLPMLGNVLLLCFFVFFIFGIVGVQLWAGLLRQRCYIPEDNVNAILKSTYWR